MFGTKQTALQEILRQPIDDRLILYAASKTSRIIVCEPLPSKSEAPNPEVHSQNLSTIEDDTCNHNDSDLPSLKNFLSALIYDCEVDTYILLIALVYFSRLRATLTSTERGLPCTPHRIILASLIHAAHHTGYCRTRDRLRNICLSEGTALPLVRFSREDVMSMEEDLDARLQGDFTTSDGVLLRKLKKLDGRVTDRTGSGLKGPKFRSKSAPTKTVRRWEGLLVTSRRGTVCQKPRSGQPLKPQPLQKSIPEYHVTSKTLGFAGGYLSTSSVCCNKVSSAG